jgi:hypothetical protein
MWYFLDRRYENNQKRGKLVNKNKNLVKLPELDKLKMCVCVVND